MYKPAEANAVFLVYKQVGCERCSFEMYNIKPKPYEAYSI